MNNIGIQNNFNLTNPKTMNIDVIIDRKSPFAVVQNKDIVYASNEFKKMMLLHGISFTSAKTDWTRIFPDGKIDENDFNLGGGDNLTVQKELKTIYGITMTAISRKIYWDQSLAFIVFFKILP